MVGHIKFAEKQGGRPPPSIDSTCKYFKRAGRTINGVSSATKTKATNTSAESLGRGEQPDAAR
jgi:hypothetical protein